MENYKLVLLDRKCQKLESKSTANNLFYVTGYLNTEFSVHLFRLLKSQLLFGGNCYTLRVSKSFLVSWVIEVQVTNAWIVQVCNARF